MNLKDFVKIQTNERERELIFIVDTQADVSLIKISELRNTNEINTMEKITLRGITDGTIESYGTINVDLIFNNIYIKHKFHVVDRNFPIPSNGIMGKDFIQKYMCQIDYYDMTFTIRKEKYEIKTKIMLGPNEDEIAIPPRCEIFKTFQITNFNETSFIESREIANGIFIANTIIHEQTALIRVINTTDAMKIISNKLNCSSGIKNYHIFTLDKTENTEERTRKLKEIFTRNTPREKLNTLMNLCGEYTDIFTMDGDKMTTNNFYTQKIRISDETPAYTKNYRIAHGQKEEINQQVGKLIKNDLIENSLSPYNSPIILVPKKSSNGMKKWRLCIDYRRVNEKLIPDKFPLPRMDVILDGLGRAKYFSTLDLFSGFHQIPIDKNSREITAFSTEQGIFQWKVLPFGLNIAPNSFRLNNVFCM